MYKIREAKKLNDIIYLMVVEAPRVAKHLNTRLAVMADSYFHGSFFDLKVRICVDSGRLGQAV